MNPNVMRFAEAADQFCGYIEAAHTLDLDERLAVGAALLAEVYAWGVRLPDAPPVDSEAALPAPLDVPAWRGYGDLTLYWQVPHPFEWSAPQNESLSDALLGVYTDIKRGLLAYQQGGLAQAAAQWRHTLPTWGSQAVDALRGLHYAMLTGGE
jgi:Domain of unknown function (DUF5063)